MNSWPGDEAQRIILPPKLSQLGISLISAKTNGTQITFSMVLNSFEIQHVIAHDYIRGYP